MASKQLSSTFNIILMFLTHTLVTISLSHLNMRALFLTPENIYLNIKNIVVFCVTIRRRIDETFRPYLGVIHGVSVLLLWRWGWSWVGDPPLINWTSSPLLVLLFLITWPTSRTSAEKELRVTQHVAGDDLVVVRCSFGGGPTNYKFHEHCSLFLIILTMNCRLFHLFCLILSMSLPVVCVP